MNDFELYAYLKDLDEIVSHYRPGKEISAKIQETAQQISTQRYRVAVVGEFNRGKSSLINALLGTRILPADILPLTAAVTRVNYGEEQSIRICLKDGSEQTCSPEELELYATKMSAESEKRAALVQEIKVSYPSVFLKNHFELIDTPGLNESEKMSELTMKTIGHVDGAIIVLSPDSPLSMSEQKLVLDLLKQPQFHYLVFVVNKLDRIRREEKKNRLLNEIKERITKNLLPLAIESGAGLEEKALRVLKEPAVFGVSASQAMEAFEQDDMELLEESRFPEFKTDLLALLTAAQGRNPYLRAADLMQQALREVPGWIESELEETSRQLDLLGKKLDAVQKYPDTARDLAPALERGYMRLNRETSLSRQGLGEETARLNKRLCDMFIQELCTVTWQTNTDPVIRDCLYRAWEQADSYMRKYGDELKDKAWNIFSSQMLEPFIQLREEAGLSVGGLSERATGWKEEFPRFGWVQEPVLPTDNLAGREVMPTVREALASSLELFSSEAGNWISEKSSYLLNLAQEDMKNLKDQPKQLGEEISRTLQYKTVLEERKPEDLTALAKLEQALFEKEAAI